MKTIDSFEKVFDFYIMKTKKATDDRIKQNSPNRKVIAVPIHSFLDVG